MGHLPKRARGLPGSAYSIRLRDTVDSVPTERDIGSDVWVGGGAIILGGVTIGSRAVIGAGSVVTRSIPEGVFAAGNPCRIIRAITE